MANSKRKKKKKEELLIPSAKDAIQRRKMESLAELAVMGNITKIKRSRKTKKSKAIEKPKITKTPEKIYKSKSELRAFIERCNLADELDRKRVFIAKEQEKIKKIEEDMQRKSIEIKKTNLEIQSKMALSTPPPRIKLPENFVDKPVDNEVSSYRENVAEKQKKYWG